MLKRSPPSALAGLSARLVPVSAALMGAAGVALGAVAAHRVGAESLSIAASLLLVHAAAILALAAHAPRSRLIRIAQSGLILGTVLFSGTLTLNVLAGIQADPSPAPLGGVLMILAWLIAAAAFLFDQTKY
jgi:uncharacterized membrane protein YgdD (TMEM256/DUF423 family)